MTVVKDSTLEKIYHSSLKFLDPLTPEETYANIVNEAVKLVDGEYGVVVLKTGKEFERVYSTNPNQAQRKVRSRANIYKTFTSQEPRIVHASKVLRAHPELKNQGIQSTLLIPLSYKNQALGVLLVNSKRNHKFGKNELEILKLFGSMASISIRKTHLYDETKKALQSRDLFISMAAHELRTPLTSISGYVQLLRNRMVKVNSQESRWVEHLYGETVRMTILINELLEINRIKSGKLNYVWKECDLREITQRIVSNFIFAYPERQLLFEDKTQINNAIVIGDYDKILQVVTNLVDNAAKFSQVEEPIYLSLRLKDQNFIIEVRDRGIGISREDLPKIFEGFYRGSNNKEKEGMGLGLFLVKDIIQHHHGNIDIRSRPNKGTTIAVKLPIMKS